MQTYLGSGKNSAPAPEHVHARTYVHAHMCTESWECVWPGNNALTVSIVTAF